MVSTCYAQASVLRRRLSSSTASRLAISPGLSISPPMTMTGGATGGGASVPSSRLAGATLRRRLVRSSSLAAGSARFRPREEVERLTSEESLFAEDGPGVGAADEDASGRSGERGLSTVAWRGGAGCSLRGKKDDDGWDDVLDWTGSGSAPAAANGSCRCGSWTSHEWSILSPLLNGPPRPGS